MEPSRAPRPDAQPDPHPGADPAGRGTAHADELDLVLINALQWRPRATWTELAPALEVDAVTLARRWRRLVRDGCAWVTCYPRPAALTAADGGQALVEVAVERGAGEAVAARLAADPYAVSVDHITGTHDILVTVTAARTSAMLGYLQDRFTALPGVVGTRTHLVTRVYAEGADWRLRTLDAGQRAALVPPSPPARVEGASFSPTDPELVTALGADGRASHTELAARTGTSTTTVARRLHRLLAAGLVRMRCDMAQPLTGAPLRVTLWLRVPPTELDATARRIAALPEVRLCAGVVGAANLVVMAWLRHVADVPRLEVELLGRFPYIDVADRAVTIRADKQVGRILAADGRAVGYVPMALWDGPPVDHRWAEPAPAPAPQPDSGTPAAP